MGDYPYFFPHGLMFHRIHKRGEASLGQGSIDEVEFENIIRKVGIDRILTPSEWVSRVKSGSLQQGDLCISFDDGLAGQYNYALPVLDKFGLKAFWFFFSSVFCGESDKNEIASYINTCLYDKFDDFGNKFISLSNISLDEFNSEEYKQFQLKLKNTFSFYSESDIRYRFVRNFLVTKERFDSIIYEMLLEFGIQSQEIIKKLWMTEENIYTLHKQGHCIGLHSYSHPFMMGSLPVTDQESEYRKNYNHLSKIINETIYCMSHPLNSYSEETLKILEKMGIICGFCSNHNLGGAVSISSAKSLELQRVDSAEILKLL